MNWSALLLVSLLAANPAGDGAPVDFDTQVVPIFTKAGCNSGACHGAAVGRGGFRLSLLGSNPELDHERIVHELEGRRVNFRSPADSLLISKPTETLIHGGGARFDVDSHQVRLLERWIQEGGTRLQRRQLTQLTVTPRRLILERPGDAANIQVTATFSDGSQQDVSRDTLFTSSDESSLTVNGSGELTVLRRGQHSVLLRYLSRVEAVTVIVPLSDTPVSLARERRVNFIDDHILNTLETLRIPPSPQASPEMLRRRLSLDLTGRLSVSEESVKNSSEQPFSPLTSYVSSDEFTDYWTWQLAKLLRIQSKSMQTEGAAAFHSWLRQQVAENRPINELIQEMLLAEGDSHVVGPANLSRVTGSPRDQAEFISETFLGSRLRCANCHDHPLDRWTQDDYHGLAAILAKVDRGRQVAVVERGEVTHPRTGEPAIPRIPGERFLERDARLNRKELADWIVSPENPLFARSFVNRVWKILMGRGLVEPVDDLRSTNPATHPELLDSLAEDFVAHNYDLRHLVLTITSSAAYSRSSKTLEQNEADDRFYSHALIKPMEAEVLADAIADVTGISDQYESHPPGTRSILLQDGATPSEALDLLGRCDRTAGCVTDTGDGGLPLRLHLINGDLLNRRIASPEGRLHQLLDDGISDSGIVDQFYIIAFGRHPAPQEKQYWIDQLAGERSHREEVWEDILWGLLNSPEFLTIR